MNRDLHPYENMGALSGAFMIVSVILIIVCIIMVIYDFFARKSFKNINNVGIALAAFVGLTIITGVASSLMEYQHYGGSRPLVFHF
jgi:hypothetical protein